MGVVVTPFKLSVGTRHRLLHGLSALVVFIACLYMQCAMIELLKSRRKTSTLQGSGDHANYVSILFVLAV